MTVGLWRVNLGAGPRLARGDTTAGPAELLAPHLTVTDFLTDDGTLFATLGDLPSTGAVPDGATVLAPLDRQPVWAAGVTFPRSREARNEEAHDGGDVYDRVYGAKRPELFFKAHPETVVGPHDRVGIRADSSWNVPEPELAVVAGPDSRIRAVTLGNDMSSRSIEGENPLYLPQAKVYDRSCGLGPALVPVDLLPDWAGQSIELVITRAGDQLFSGSVDLRTTRRPPEDLVRWLFAANTFPAGVVLLTGTSMVPPADLTLMDGDRVTVASPALGALTNTVVSVGHTL